LAGAMRRRGLHLARGDFFVKKSPLAAFRRSTLPAKPAAFSWGGGMQVDLMIDSYLL
jgi:hypothetical protein